MAREENSKAFSKSKWGVRHRIVLATFVMCAIFHPLRYVMSLGIVAMVNQESGDLGEEDNLLEVCPSSTPLIILEPHPNSTTVSPALKNKKELYPKFNWNEKEQGLILGSFFWGYVLIQFPAGLLTLKFGCKWMIAFGMLSTGVLSLCLPYGAILGGIYTVVVIRVLQGVSQGFVIPAYLQLLGKWVPLEERARIGSFCYSGMSFGTAITMMISGHLVTEFGWPFVFYFPGAVTLIWFVSWVWIVQSEPEQHSGISEEEVAYIKGGNLEESSSQGENSEGNNNKQEPRQGGLPWREIACSLPFWAVFISQNMDDWTGNVFKSMGSKYLHSVLGFDIKANGYLSALPYIMETIFAISVGLFSDFLIERKCLSVLNTRKLCNTVGQWGAVLCFVGIILAACNRPVAIPFFIVARMITGAMMSGTYINIIDIAPTYVGPLKGFTNSIANIGGFGAPWFAGMILYADPSIVGWRLVFLIPVVTGFIGNAVFLYGAEVKPPAWNFKKELNES